MRFPDLTSFGSYAAGVSTPSASSRLRLLSCQLERAPGARSRVTVAFADGDDGAPLVRHEEGPTCTGGDLRLAALATLAAVSHATAGTLRLELVGVKSMRAFDTTVMVVGLLAHLDGVTSRVIGTAVADEDALAGVARATLHALNRLAEPRIARTDRAA